MVEHREHLHTRLNIFWMFLYGAIGLLVLRLFQIQVIQNVYYARAAERNRTQILRQTAPRGRIYTRGGEAIATNQAIFSLIYLPSEKNDDPASLDRLARDLAPLLHRESDKIAESLHRAIQEESAIRLAEKLPPKIMFKLSELRTLYPGVKLIVEARRYYPYGAFASHLLGYMGRMDEASWKVLKGQGYRVDSWVGKAGIEKIFERDLRGRDGGLRMEVDARGRLKRVLERIPWKPGSNVYLTIDAQIQKAAEDALRASPSKSGAVVALDPANGNLLALASVPDFDPNLFLQPEEDRGAEGSKSIPEFNLALQGTYPPGSTFKIITGAAMLNEGRADPKDKTYCPGYFELGNHVFLCWDPKGHHWQDWIGGLAHSCDVYFFKMGLRTGGDLIERYERMFHLGSRTRLGLPGEAAGRVFGPQARRAVRRAWYDGDTVNLAIGQGELLVTPIQMALVIAAVANRGTVWRPHFVDRIEYADGRPEYRQKPEAVEQVRLKESTWDLLRAALEAVVRDGTGKSAQMPGLVIGGKTGTAQNPGGKDHAWFIAYAGREGEAPSLALAVLVQHGGHGAEAAIPVARRVIETALHVSPARPMAAPVSVSTGPVIPAAPVRESPVPRAAR